MLSKVGLEISRLRGRRGPGRSHWLTEEGMCGRRVRSWKPLLPSRHGAEESDFVSTRTPEYLTAKWCELPHWAQGCQVGLVEQRERR